MSKVLRLRGRSVQAQRRLPASTTVSATLPCPRHISGRVGPAHRGKHLGVGKGSVLSPRILAHQPHPFGNQSRLDPRCIPAHRAPEMAGDAHPAEGRQVVGIEFYDAWRASEAASLDGEDASSHRVGHEGGRHSVDGLSSVSKRCMKGLRPIKGEPRADPQVACRHAGEKSLEAFLREPEPLCVDIRWCLGEALADQRQVQPQPVKRDKAQRNAQELVARVLNHPGRAICGATEGAEQA